MTRSILGRISRLRAGAMEIAKGNLATRIDILGRDEFAELATSFNHMAGELARHQRQLMRSQRLATLGHVAAGVAHEINNPLGVILGYAKLLRAGAQTESDTTEGLRIIEDEAHQCQRIVEGLLTLARTPKLHLSEVDLAELAGEAIERLKETGKLDGLRVETASSNTSVHAWGDEAKLRQVIANVPVRASSTRSSPPSPPAPVSAWRSRKPSSRRTEVPSRSIPKRAAARASPSGCRGTLVRWKERRHDPPAGAGGRRQGEHPQPAPEGAGGSLRGDHRGRRCSRP